MTFVDYMDNKWHRPPEKEELREIANITSWNIWQMDGLKGTVPMGVLKEKYLFYILKWGKQGEVLRQPYSDK